MNETTDNNPFIFDEAELRASLANTPLASWADALIEAVEQRQIQHGDLPRWQAALDALPMLPIAQIDLEHELGVAVLTAKDVTADKLNELETALQGLKPWRKGPYRIANVTIDTEWHSDWKWNRVLPHISDLKDRTVLDVGCGSGYHMWRMRAQGAKTVMGIDPGLLFSMQFKAVQRYINDNNVCLLPLTMETMPEPMQVFDTVFSMGVLYHRKDPHAHLKELLQSMRPGAELIMETLVVLGEDETMLELDGRYARMRNIWTLPTVPMLGRWMRESGFTNIRFVSLDITSRLEQRTTDWMPYESLIDSLDPENLSLTVEGHPRPRRAIMIADAPS